jgi:radical SAM protein with 4Fe4S-binding SPASM domain
MLNKERNIIHLGQNTIFDPSVSSFIFNSEKYKDFNNYTNLINKIRNSFISKRQQVFNKKRKITNLNLFPTYACHGSCPYCYSKDNINKKFGYITVDSLKASLKKITDLGMVIEPYSVRVYGGEPLLNENLYDILKYLKETYPSIEFIYISSGLLFSKDIFDRVKRILVKINEFGIKFSVGISVDFGTIPFTRTCSTYNITQSMLLDRIDELVSLGIPCVAATVVSKNTDIDNCINQLIDNHKKYKSIINKEDIITGNPRRIAYRVSVACDDEYHPTLQQLNELYDRMLQLYKDSNLITSNIFPYTDVIASARVCQINEDIYTLVYPPMYCGIYSYMIEIYPNGEIGSCHMEMFDRSVYIDDNEYNKQMILHPKKCYTCEFFMVCRGACINRLKFSEESNESYCTWIKYSYDLALERLYSMYKDDFKSYIKSNVDKEILI